MHASAYKQKEAVSHYTINCSICSTCTEYYFENGNQYPRDTDGLSQLLGSGNAFEPTLILAGKLIVLASGTV